MPPIVCGGAEIFSYRPRCCPWIKEDSLRRQRGKLLSPASGERPRREDLDLSAQAAERAEELRTFLQQKEDRAHMLCYMLLLVSLLLPLNYLCEISTHMPDRLPRLQLSV